MNIRLPFHVSVAIFLAGRASDFVTGIALPVDGGFSINIL